MNTGAGNGPDSPSVAPTGALSLLGDLMTSAEVAATIRVPAATVRYWRHIGIGPKSFKMGPRRVLYRRDDVLQWMAAQYSESG